MDNKNTYWFIFKPSFLDGKLVAIFSKEQRVEAVNYLNSIWKWKHKAEIREAEWDGGELPPNNEFRLIGGAFNPDELIDLPDNPTIHLPDEEVFKKRKEAFADWMTRGSTYKDHKNNE